MVAQGRSKVEDSEVSMSNDTNITNIANLVMNAVLNVTTMATETTHDDTATRVAGVAVPVIIVLAVIAAATKCGGVSCADLGNGLAKLGTFAKRLCGKDEEIHPLNHSPA